MATSATMGPNVGLPPKETDRILVRIDEGSMCGGAMDWVARSSVS